MKEENTALTSLIIESPAPPTGALAANAPPLPTTAELEAPVAPVVETPPAGAVAANAPLLPTAEVLEAPAANTEIESESISQPFWAPYTPYTICGSLEEDTFYACKTETCPVDDIKTVCKPLNTCSCEL